ncbi:MAG: M15 family metallopeptidase [Elusimicrobiota bacterium]|jgi:hypothetical protein|nr:M15 family metallopeptidase [Elusimicrobiota bacterium]
MKTKNILLYTALCFCLTQGGFTQNAEPCWAKDDFAICTISKGVFKVMEGKSYPAGTLIPKEDLRLLRIKYYGFDGEIKTGDMIVHKTVAGELLDIFQELLAAEYPIEKISLIDYYDADDMRSMTNNNTSAFYWRNITGGKSLSYHAVGLAVDINPLYNPYVKGNIVEPPSAAVYLDRTTPVKGLIANSQDAAVRAFKKRGWRWGGDWRTLKDYQHFEKHGNVYKKYKSKLAEISRETKP